MTAEVGLAKLDKYLVPSRTVAGWDKPIIARGPRQEF
jgi:hypothetical protein